MVRIHLLSLIQEYDTIGSISYPILLFMQDVESAQLAMQKFQGFTTHFGGSGFRIEFAKQRMADVCIIFFIRKLILPIFLSVRFKCLQLDSTIALR